MNIESRGNNKMADQQGSQAPSGGGQGGGYGSSRPHSSGPGGGGGRPSRDGGGPGGGAGPRKGGKRQFFRKRKVCRFCVDKIDYIDYKKADMLNAFVQDRGKILPRRMTGTCSRHQRWLCEAIKRSRNIALLSFASEL
jgi:small subunit ribosomal protein S18